jgi:hypothetical protein
MMAANSDGKNQANEYFGKPGFNKIVWNQAKKNVTPVICYTMENGEVKIKLGT